MPISTKELLPVDCRWRWLRFPLPGHNGVLALTTITRTKKKPVETEYEVSFVGQTASGYHVRLTRTDNPDKPEKYDVLLAGEYSQCDCGDFVFHRAYAETFDLRVCKHIKTCEMARAGLVEGVTEGSTNERSLHS